MEKESILNRTVHPARENIEKYERLIREKNITETEMGILLQAATISLRAIKNSFKDQYELTLEIAYPVIESNGVKLPG